MPDLATDTGKPSKNATVWTYTLKDDLKYEDGSKITTADIKYGIERSFAAELSGGAPYLCDWLIGGDTYQGPYKEQEGARLDRDARREDHRLPPAQARG